eukprot:COSAG05_NODE_2043_length_3647_cov_2.893461_2_plen_85_part_00
MNCSQCHAKFGWTNDWHGKRAVLNPATTAAAASRPAPIIIAGEPHQGAEGDNNPTIAVTARAQVAKSLSSVCPVAKRRCRSCRN